ncbi:hypothetical protein FCOIX_13304 [Fusarium coicis]|nr:hypothetical protein FCOIX_13304 [Fusarium coicis]
MLDPVTAIGLASSIVAFVDFSAKLVKGSIEIYQVSDGTPTEDRSSQAVAVAMERFVARFIIQQPSQPSDEEKELIDLATNCDAHDGIDKRQEMIEEAHEKTFQWIFDVDGAARGDNAGSLFSAADDWDSVDTRLQ